MVNSLKFVLQRTNVITILGLLIIHFILKESSYISSIFFYTFSLPIIIGIVLFYSIFLTRKERKYNLILASLLLIFWLARSFKIHSTEPVKQTDLEVVFWNASRTNNFEMAFTENGSIPDVMVLSEAKWRNLEEIQKKYPRYYFYKSIRDIYIFSKSTLDILSEKTSERNSAIVNFTTEGINFYAIDLQGDPRVYRKGELEFVDSFLKEKSNTIILGDFNLPYESSLLKNIKRNFNHAFNTKGNGFRETWFWNIPLLSIDHIWVSKDLKILKTRKIGTFKSDHNMLKTYIKR